ncbi:DUF6191 domain-containing protein [Kitasatospora viridis]|uniref:Uncharacterized protein n=1 Tax=Kitasatospora viridis TaxID=281105 RepID=A0A561SF67_9ACTN|nr:DUF6191 domain-containing protein [Kitasatospora viridis]TWF73516.1 hypothetical protein FHX73_15128 [Kitasatospora viridis]
MSMLFGTVGGLLIPALVTAFALLAGLARRVLARARPAAERGAAAGATEELHALLYPGKRIQLEQRQVELVLREDEHDGAPARHGIDLAGGRALLRMRRSAASGGTE